MSGVLRGLLDGRAATQDDQIRERDFLARLCAVEVLLDLLERLQRLGEFGGIIDFPVLLRSKPDARAVRTAPLVGATEAGGGRPRRGEKPRD